MGLYNDNFYRDRDEETRYATEKLLGSNEFL